MVSIFIGKFSLLMSSGHHDGAVDGYLSVLVCLVLSSDSDLTELKVYVKLPFGKKCLEHFSSEI